MSAKLHFNGGGDNGAGVVFQLTPAGGYAVLCSLPEDDGFRFGALPGLVKGLDGDFYGVDSGSDIIFKVTSAGVFTVLHRFLIDPVSGGVDGLGPVASLIVGNDGNFYGTTADGGTNNVGTVYKMTPDGTVTILHTSGEAYNRTDSPGGTQPYGSLVQGPDGNFYGTTPGGGTGQGTVFKITPTGDFTSLYSFNPTKSTLSKDGSDSLTGLTLGPDGNFYGVNGTFYKITPDGGDRLGRVDTGK